jgi:hypothetical protein
MKDHILCAIDFSESSMHALRWATKVAVGADGQLDVLYSYRLIQTGKVSDVLSFKRKTEEESKKKFGELERMFIKSADVRRNFITEIGFYSDNIEKFVRKNPLTVVVMSEFMAHSVYDHKGQSLLQFMKSIHVPLLVVPACAEKNTPALADSPEASKDKVAI